MKLKADRQEQLDRRQMLRSLAAVAGGAGLLSACSPQPEGAATDNSVAAGTGSNAMAERQMAERQIDFADPGQSLEAFTRIFADTVTANSTVGWFGGTVYAVIGDSSPVIPLLGLEGIGIHRAQPLASGGYRIFNRELAFYKDLRTGEFIDEWQNPLNNRLVETFPMHNMTVNAETAPILKFDVEGTELAVPFPATWEFLGDHVFSTFEIHVSVPSELKPDEWPLESPGPMTRISEMFMRTVSRADLYNPELTSVPYTGAWTRLSSWYPWMLMGPAEGHLFFRANMAKLKSLDDVPAAFLAKARKEHEAYLVAPDTDSWGTPNDSTYNMYKRLRTPQPQS